MNQKGFTLLEVVIVIIIISVLTSLALPRLMSTIEYSRRAEAFSMIASVRSALERCFLMHDGSYSECDAGGGVFPWEPYIEWSTLGIEDPGKSPNAHFDYVVRSGTGTGYRITAYRNTLDGGDGTSWIVAEQSCSFPSGECFYDVAGKGVFKPLGFLFD